MSVYTVRSLEKLSYKPAAQASVFDLPWQEAEEGLINCFPWGEEGGYRPDSRFYLLYGQDRLYALLLTRGEDEKDPRRVVTEHQGQVSKDSCLEFFFSYNPARADYVNFETNALATIHAGFGPGRGNRLKLPQDELGGLRYRPLAAGGLKDFPFAYDWGVIMEIPQTFLGKFWPEAETGFCSGQICKANFYKCGDLCAHEHYACWSQVEAPKPDYHRPECFGQLILE